MSDSEKTELEAAAFRRLVSHFRDRPNCRILT